MTKNIQFFDGSLVLIRQAMAQTAKTIKAQPKKFRPVDDWIKEKCGDDIQARHNVCYFLFETGCINKDNRFDPLLEKYGIVAYQPFVKDILIDKNGKVELKTGQREVISDVGEIFMTNLLKLYCQWSPEAYGLFQYMHKHFFLEKKRRK